MSNDTYRGVVPSQPNFSLRPESNSDGRFSLPSCIMLSKLFNVLVLVLALLSVSSATYHRRRHQIDVTQYNSSYYHPDTGIGFKAVLEDSGRNPFNPKIAFRGMSCYCQELTCSCCTGVNITVIKFDRLVCTKFVYQPEEFAIRTALTMNGKELLSKTFNVKNPPPLCAPLPYLPFMSFCIRFYDVRTVGKNLHACIDLETRIVGSPILIMHFNCVQMGVDGFSWTKPGEGNNQTTAHLQPQVSEPEVYDEVDFEQQDLEVYANYTSTLTPEEEAQIGQLKL